MKHHEYQIYYGGFKKHIPFIYCKECDKVIHYSKLPCPYNQQINKKIKKILPRLIKQSNSCVHPQLKGHSPKR